ncbi:unnamed protein product [Acanthosepion pharaonis]|uniref:Box C/D snoRNA protein 1 n=1 Tax=Acanthosepion pharaonis TaxID=158019 RepID=A0A812DFW3_ACAPH|nr:unnamed protein product [Sepia pharaonis]
MDAVQTQTEEISDNNNTLHKNLCEQCHVQPSKYTCPRCEIRTCSLGCVKSHKVDSGCDGIRDKTAYIPLEDFSDINLLSDYRLLEDVARVAEHGKRDILMKQHRKPPFLQYLTKAAYKRNIRFRTMPFPMYRRKKNNSIYYRKIDSILWDITWVFPHSAVLHTEKRTSEKLLVSEAFQNVLNPNTANAILLYKLKAYRTVDVKTLSFYMKQELRSKEKNKYYNLCAEESLEKNLSGKVVLEHPIIHVLFPEETSKYSLVSDTENLHSNNVPTSHSGEILQGSEMTKDKHIVPENEVTEAAPDELPIMKINN